MYLSKVTTYKINCFWPPKLTTDLTNGVGGEREVIIILSSKSSFLDVFWMSHFLKLLSQDRHLHMLEYQVSTASLVLSQVFHKLEILRKTGSIEDYSVTQTTLDQVGFICFY